MTPDLYKKQYIFWTNLHYLYFFGKTANKFYILHFAKFKFLNILSEKLSLAKLSALQDIRKCCILRPDLSCLHQNLYEKTTQIKFAK